MEDTEFTILFKKRDGKTYAMLAEDENGIEYVGDITKDDIGVICYEIETENDIVNMSPLDFISKVWDLCSYMKLDNCNNIDFYHSNFKEFSQWFDHTVVEWYCKVIQGLI